MDPGLRRDDDLGSLVGWVERRETHHPVTEMAGFAAAQPTLQILIPLLAGSVTVRRVGWAERSEPILANAVPTDDGLRGAQPILRRPRLEPDLRSRS